MEKIKIVIADCFPVVREGIRSFLENQMDIEVVGEACDGEEAINLVEKIRPDMVILDIYQPKISGVQIPRLMKSRFPELGVIIFTTLSNDDFVFTLYESGVDGYLLKTDPGSVIIDAIRKVRKGGQYWHPKVAGKVSLWRAAKTDRLCQSDVGADLSDREKEVLNLAATGLTNKDIADRLCLSIRTVQGHFNSIFHKMDVNSRTEAIFHGVKRGWISFENLM